MEVAVIAVGAATDHADCTRCRKGNLTMSKSERRPRLTAVRKSELYLATRSPNAPLGEILRHYEVHLDDLRATEQIVEGSALAQILIVVAFAFCQPLHNKVQ